jgi:hypothetical protein
MPSRIDPRNEPVARSGERVAEFVIRVARQNDGSTLLDVLVRLRAGTAVVDHVQSDLGGSLSVSAVHGAVHSMHDALISHLSLNGGVQLSLDDSPH